MGRVMAEDNIIWVNNIFDANYRYKKQELSALVILARGFC